MTWSVILGFAVFGTVWTAYSRGRLSRIQPTQLFGLSSTSRPGQGLFVGCLVLTGAIWLLLTKRGQILAVAFGVVGVAAVVRRLHDGWRGRQVRRERQIAVIELCDALAAELRAGLPADLALVRSCSIRPEWSSIATTGRLGGDVTAAFKRAATQPGAAGLGAVAAGWEVAARSGASLAAVLERIAGALRSDDDARSEVIASLGPPRATAKMLAVLPAFGLALGWSMGARPVAFLVGTDVGLACLLFGVVLAASGVFWVERLATSAEI